MTGPRDDTPAAGWEARELRPRQPRTGSARGRDHRLIRILSRSLPYLLSAFLAVGATANLMAPPAVAAEYRAWGYRVWFHFVTGSLEILGALGLAFARTRTFGALIASCVMVAAAATLLLHGQWLRMLVPLIVLALLSIILARRSYRPIDWNIGP